MLLALLLGACAGALLVIFKRSLQSRRDWGQLVVAVSLTIIIFLTLRPLPLTPAAIAEAQAGALGKTINFVPFQESLKMWEKDRLVFLKNVLGNLLLLIPLVMGLRLLNWSPAAIVMIIILTSFSIELLQLLKNFLYQFPINHVDIDDFIYNVGGGLAAAFLPKRKE